MDEDAATPLQTDGYTNPTDYAVMGGFDKSINIEGIQTVQIYCYCESGVIRTESFDEKLTLKVIGTNSSVGYHGAQEIPEEISEDILYFKVTRIGSTLKLESHEFIYIHHAYLIDHLEISVPPRIDIQLNKIEWDELQGRKID